MTDFAGFKHGATTFPLTTGSSYSLLHDCDAPLFYTLEFVASILETHLGDRLVEEATNAGAEQITAAVAETLPCNPEPFLQSEHVKFPLLSMYRKGTTFRYIGQRKVSVQNIELAYVLPPMRASEAERLLPILHAVEAVIDNRIEQGFDPGYTPTSPTGTAGEVVWSSTRAGLVRAEVTASQTGAYTPTADLYFPAVVMTIEMQERSEALVTELETFTGADITEDVFDEDSTVEEVVLAKSIDAPVLTSLTPATGTKAGGTPVTITGTGFVVGRTYRAIFGDADADSVVAASTTSLTCVTPQHVAYPTLAADVYVIDQDEQVSNTLSDVFTFTSP